jgi:hypothetical protein
MIMVCHAVIPNRIAMTTEVPSGEGVAATTTFKTDFAENCWEGSEW